MTEFFSFGAEPLQWQYNRVFSNAPTFVDDNDYREEIFTTSLLLISCSTIAVALRTVRSWQSQRHFELHDLFITSAVACALVMSGGCAHLTTLGLGMHDYNNIIARDGHFQKIVIAVNCFYFSCNFFVKLALLQMYRKFTRETCALLSIYFMETASLLFWLGSILATVLACIPLEAVWNWNITRGWCVQQHVFYMSNAAIMIGMDIVLYMMPVVFTWKLNLPRVKKVGLNVLFGLGSIVLTASAVRMWIVWQAINHGDMSYNYGRSLLVSQIENHIAIIIACAPAMRSVCPQGLFQAKDILSTGRGKFGRLWTSSTASEPSSPYSDHCSIPTPPQSAFRFPKADPFSMFGSIFGSSSKPTTQNSTDDDLELGFHETTCEFIPSITTTITGGGAPPRPPSSKNKIYITREIHITEEYIKGSGPSTSADTLAAESDKSSVYSTQPSDSTGISAMDMDIAALPMPSPKCSKENFTDEDGVMRKDFADIMKNHV